VGLEFSYSTSGETYLSYIHPISGAGCLEIMLSVWQGLENSNLSLIENLDNLTSLGQSGLSLSDELDTLLLGLLLSGIVGLNSLDECFVASTLADMLNSNVDSLAELVTTVNLSDLNTDRGLGDVENDSSSAMIELVRHTLVD
jgi:hypothetical protein